MDYYKNYYCLCLISCETYRTKVCFKLSMFIFSSTIMRTIRPGTTIATHKRLL